MRKVFLLLSLLLLVNLVFASSINPSMFVNAMAQEMGEEVPHEGRGEIAEIVVKHFGNERIVLNFRDENETFFVVMEDARIVDVSNIVTEGTVEINIKNMTIIQGILTGESDPKKAIVEGDIGVRGLTFGNKIKYGILNIVIRLLGRFI